MRYQAGGQEWLYPHAGDEYPTDGAKVFLLTKGGIATVGAWDKAFSVGWLPLPKRNQEKEHYDNHSMDTPAQRSTY